MSLKSRFLTLSIREQIYITIIGLHLFCILVILSICGSLAYQILKEDFKQKKLYFYDIYKDYIESCFYFQNFYLLQYEEIIKRMQKQLWKFHNSISIYESVSTINLDVDKKLLKFDINSYFPINITEQNLMNNNNDNYLFYTCLYDDPFYYENLLNLLKKNYNGISSLISSNDIYKSFKIPIYENFSIIDSPIFYDTYSMAFYSFNKFNILKKIYEIIGNEFDIYAIMNYYNEKPFSFIQYEFNEIIDDLLINKLPLIEHMFSKAINDIIKEFPNYNSSNMQNGKNFRKLLSEYLSNIDYGNNKFSLLISLDDLNVYLFIETNIINNYLYFINNKLSSFIDMYFIPLYYENNTILSPELCQLFLLKQFNYNVDNNNKINELFNQIKKGESNIEKCFRNEKTLDNQLEIKEILNLNFSNFMYISNSTINQGIINLNNSPYYFMKYTYPNYNSLKDFKTEFILLDQINYYLFVNFRDPIKYCFLLSQISLNCFHLIVLSITYIWFFCLFINLLNYYKTIYQLTKPIKNLQEAIELSSIKDENVFKYKYDDFINELFLTCKELLIGQNNKNNHEIGLDKFNILSNHNNKQNYINENIYSKNLIINFDKMNQLINQKKSLMDFSNNIKLNEFNNNKNKKNKKKKSNNINKSSMDIRKNINSLLNSNNNQENNTNDLNEEYLINNIVNDNKDFIKNKKEKEKEDRKPYKRLFQITNYLYYYMNKKEQNYFEINNNTFIYKGKKENTNLSKSTKKDNMNTQEDENKNIFINMLSNKDITYLWYMEAKKNNNNKCINYNINNKYEELFMEYYP